MAMTNGVRRMFWRVATLLAVCASVVPLFAQKDEEKCLENSAAALQQVLSENNGLPKTILDEGHSVIMFPGIKKVAIFPWQQLRELQGCRDGWHFRILRKVSR